MNSLTLSFNNVNLTSFKRNGKIYFTASHLAQLLEYKDPASVSRIYSRNKDEFTEDMTETVKMTFSGNLEKRVRIFSLLGAHLVAMFANTDVAKKCRKWILELIRKELEISSSLPNTITPEQQQAIQSAVQQAHHRTGLHWQEIYRQLKAMFHIAKYDQLPQDQYGNAMAFIMNLQAIALPPVEKKFTFEFTEHELQQIVWAWFALLRGTELCQILHPALKQIGSHYAASVYDIAYEYRSTLRQAHNVLTRITEQFECEQGNNWRVLKYLRAYNPKSTGFQLDIL